MKPTYSFVTLFPALLKVNLSKASLKDVLKESDTTYPHITEDCKAEKVHDQSSAAKRGFVYHHS